LSDGPASRTHDADIGNVIKQPQAGSEQFSKTDDDSVSEKSSLFDPKPKPQATAFQSFRRPDRGAQRRSSGNCQVSVPSLSSEKY
jgi:hypothetical protein